MESENKLTPVVLNNCCSSQLRCSTWNWWRTVTLVSQFQLHCIC